MELNYTMNINDNDVKLRYDNNLPVPTISLINCDVRNQEFTLRIQLGEKGINIDAPINLKHIKNWMTKVEKQDAEHKYMVIQSIKEKFRFNNVLSDSEIYDLEKDKDDAVYKYKIARKKFERQYCNGYEDWHRLCQYDLWGKYNQNLIIICIMN